MLNLEIIGKKVLICVLKIVTLQKKILFNEKKHIRNKTD